MKKIFFALCLFSSAILCAQDSVSTGPVVSRADYIEDVSGMINISPFIIRPETGFGISGEKSLKYSPNEGLSFGLKLQHKWLAVAASYTPRRLQDENIGQTDYFNLVINSYGKSLGVDAYFLSYRGYIFTNLKDYEEVTPQKKNPNQFRYDLGTINTGFNVYYLFNNKKFSYRSVFLHNELQKKSAGSFLVTAAFNYYRLRGDSTIVPVRYAPETEEEGRIRNGDFYSFALMPGYAYTLVAFRRFFVTLAPSYGITYQLQDYSTANNLGVSRHDIFGRFMGRAGIGYNVRRFYIVCSTLNDVFRMQLAKGTRINNELINVSLYVGFRLDVPRPLRKVSDLMGK